MPLNVELARTTWERYIYARDNGHLDYVRKANQCEQYFYGNHWTDKQRKKLEGQSKPVLTINKIFSTLITIMGEQLQNQATVGFLPTAGADPETAIALNKLYIHILNNVDMKHLESEWFDEGIITSRGFLDVRLGFDDSMKGEVEISLLNGKNVIIDPDANTYDPDDWNEVFITKWMSPIDIEMNYNKADAQELRLKSRVDFNFGIDSVDSLHNTFGGRAQYIPTATSGVVDRELRRFIRVVERQYRVIRSVEHFVDLETGDTRRIPEGWERERIGEVLTKYGLGTTKKKIKDIKWDVIADNYALHSEWSPYKHFTPLPFFPVFNKGKTIGLVENLISSQDALNKTSSQELHVVNTTANSGWQMEEDQLVNMDQNELEQRGAETGIVLVRRSGSLPLEKIQPNQVPTGLDRLAYKQDENIKEISGVGDSQRGLDRADVAAKAIQAKQAAGGVNQAKVMFNLARSRQILATRILDLVQEFYTEERVMNITNGGLNPKAEELTINQLTPEGEIVNDLTIGEFTVTVSDVPARDSYEESQFQEAVQLRELGIAIPDSVLVENSHLGRKEEIAATLLEAEGGGESTDAEKEAAELDLEIQKLEVAEKKAGLAVKEADAEYTRARAKKTSAEADNVGSEESNVIELQKVRDDLQIKREQIAAELAMKKTQQDGEMRLKTQESLHKRRLDEAESEERIQIQKDQAAATKATQKAAGDKK